jgi:hypothetical protein
MKFMKSISRILFLFFALALGGTFIGCSDDDESSGGTPVISYVRITKPTSSDSLLVAAGQGQMIAIMGENLKDVRQLWINDQRAFLNPSFITNSTIITRVPAQIPNEITDKMKMIFADGHELIYDFSVDISEPYIDYMKSEYVNTGNVAVIVGDYFYEPIKVFFNINDQEPIEGEIVSVEDQRLEVRIPEGVEPGPIVIMSNFGASLSPFWFRDNRNIISSFDGSTAGMWHGPDFIVSSDDDIPNINGKFIRMKRDLGAWGWFELWVGPTASDVSLELKNIPEDAFSNPASYNLKFEINTLKSLTGANIHMYFGGDMPGERGNWNYNWLPNINTEGQWETVIIPWKDVYEANKEFQYNPSGYGVSIHFSGPSPVTGDFGLDNMRVVPISPLEN